MVSLEQVCAHCPLSALLYQPELAGKTILCSHIVNELQQKAQGTIAYIICNSYTQGKNIVSENLRRIAAQVLQTNRDLIPHAHDNYVNKALPPSIPHVRRMLFELFDNIDETLIFIDGLDEYSDPQQRSMLTEILPFAKVTGGMCKILVSSRDIPTISSKMRNRPVLSLRDEYSDVEKDIQIYLNGELQELRERFTGKEKDVKIILDQVALKAKGLCRPSLA